MLRCVAEEGEDRHRLIRMLFLHHRKIDRLAVKAWRRSGFQAALRQGQLFESRRQRDRGWIAHPATAVTLHPNVDQAVEEGAGGQHHGRSFKADA